VDGTGNMIAVRFAMTSGFRVTEQATLFPIPTGIVRVQGTTTLDITPEGQRFLLGRSLTAAGSTVDADAPRFVLMKNFAEELRRIAPR
jgi:hypothetical protein